MTTPRERPSKAGASETIRTVAAPAAPTPQAGPAPRWEDLFRAISPQQQEQLLGLALEQRVLYAHQLPVLRNGAASADQGQQFLSHLLQGKTDQLEPVRPESFEPLDAELDAVQREAVGKALATPDLFLMQGLPGTGKSRVLAEVIAQAAQKGERILLVAPAAADIDRILELVAARESLCPVRCLGKEERLDDLPAPIRALTFAERVVRLREHASQRVCGELGAAEQRCERLGRDEAVLARLKELADRWQQLEREAEGLQQQRQQLAAEVEREAQEADSSAVADSFAAKLFTFLRQRRYVLDCIDLELGKLKSELAQRQEELSAVKAQLGALRPLADAKQRKRWWTGAWWRATFLADLSPQTVELKDRQKRVQDALAELEAEDQRLSEQRRQREEELQAERLERIQHEACRRQKPIQQREAELRRQQQLLQDQWRLACWELGPDSPRPTEISAADVPRALTELRRRLEHEQQQLAFARQWAEFLDQSGDVLAARLKSCCNLVAATLAALPGDSNFGDAAGHGGNFDLLVVEEAQQLTEPEFLPLARRARRWVLVGGGETEPACSPPPASKTTTIRRNSSAPEPRLALFHRLWHNLHCDPRRWSADWTREKDRLCCRLRPILPEQRQWIETERVADFPDIELRILTLPRCEPVLAEMLFPPSMSIEQAKQYVFQELEELPVRALGHSLRWVEETERLVLRFGEQRVEGPVSVLLGLGVRETVGRAAADSNGRWHTCCLEFDKSAGWHRQRAEEWVQRHLRVRDLGRTVRLDVPHRMHPRLAAFVSNLLFADGYCLADPAADRCDGKIVDFIPVPAPEMQPPRRSGGSPPRGRALAAKIAVGGAGLELDLADPRHRDRLPAELRPGLPSRGYVNYLEAQAVVRALEGLVRDPGHSPNGNGSGSHSIGVVALYAGQAELIRRLVRQAPALAEHDVKVDVPAAFRQRECQVVLVSLTRSHAHRAVTFGDEPHLLGLALTRARSRLLLFGDPGTLIRRSQWDGPLDHLDAGGAERERDVIRQLVRRLPSHTPSARAAGVHTGSSK